MKTIKKLAKEYHKPDSEVVDWSKIVGKKCVIDRTIFDPYIPDYHKFDEVTILDFEETINIIKVKYNNETTSHWRNGIGPFWKLVFVFEPVKPEEPKNYKDLSLILEEAKKNNEYIPSKNPLRPVYPCNPPIQPYPGWDYPVNPPSWSKPNHPLQPYCLENDMFKVHLDDDPKYSGYKKEYDAHEHWTCDDLQN